jgi:hypothetical protein
VKSVYGYTDTKNSLFVTLYLIQGHMSFIYQLASVVSTVIDFHKCYVSPAKLLNQSKLIKNQI